MDLVTQRLLLLTNRLGMRQCKLQLVRLGRCVRLSGSRGLPRSGAGPWTAGEAGKTHGARESGGCVTQRPSAESTRNGTRRRPAVVAARRPRRAVHQRGSRRIMRPQPKAFPKRGDEVRGRIAPAPACGRATGFQSGGTCSRELMEAGCPSVSDGAAVDRHPSAGRTGRASSP